MKEWLVKNAPWLFSGVGIFAVIGIYKLAKFLLRKKQKRSDVKDNETKTSQQPAIKAEPETASPPIINPFEIMDAIRSAPLLQQDEVARHYVGIPIKWKGELRATEKISAEQVKLLIMKQRASKHPHEACFFCVVNFSDYPGIGLLKTGDSVHVEGIIENANKNYINLRNSKLISYGSQIAK